MLLDFQWHLNFFNFIFKEKAVKSQVNKFKKQRGIGLLELMLSLSIIAILLVMATRYFSASSEQQKINNAISQINGIAGGEASYFQSNSPPKFTKAISDLIKGNYVPAGLGGSDTNGANANPWGGNISISETSPLTVVLTNVPSDNADPSTCKKLQNTINNTMSGSDPTKPTNAVCDGKGTLTVIFH